MSRDGQPRIGTRSTDAGLLVALAGALPHLCHGLTPAAAEALVGVQMRVLAIDAAAVVSGNSIVAFRGSGAEHHVPGQPYRTLLVGRALAGGRTVVARGSRAVGCAVPSCPLTSGVAAPVRSGGRVTGAIVLLRAERRPLSGSVRRAAEAVAQFVGMYLDQLTRPDDVQGLLRQEVARAQRTAMPLAVSVFSAPDVAAQRIRTPLSSEARASDIVAVLNERSVALIQPNTALGQAQTAAERISLGLHRELGTVVRFVTATYPEAPDLPTLMRQVVAT